VPEGLAKKERVEIMPGGLATEERLGVPSSLVPERRGPKIVDWNRRVRNRMILCVVNTDSYRELDGGHI
jgi:hypothetical protein